MQNTVQMQYYDIEDRFPQQQMLFFQSFSIFHVKTIPPSLDSDLLQCYGNSETDVLKQSYYTNDFKKHYELTSQKNEFKYELAHLQRKQLQFKDIVERNNVTLNISATKWSVEQILVSLKYPEYNLIYEI